MAISKKKSNKKGITKQKKTSQGRGPNRKHGNRGGGAKGSTTSKKYTKRYRGQG